jgi:pilus assembly protein Flp/PilA
MTCTARSVIHALRRILPIPVTGRKKMSKFLKLFVRDERGVSAMEYAVLAGIVVLALGAMAATFRIDVSRMFNTLFTDVRTAQGRPQFGRQ